MLYFLDRNFWNYPFWTALFTGSLLVVIFLRYVIVSVLYKILLERLTQTARNSFAANAPQIKKEIGWALMSSWVFTILLAFMFWAYQQGVTSIYLEVEKHGWIYFFFSPLLLLVLYETYYYWLHRWMHRPGIFRIVHKVHHQSLLPTVFTAFSFHPLEAFLQFIFFPAYLMLIPMHPIMLGIVFMIFTLTAMVNHSGVEVYSGTTLRNYIIGSRHHDLHHKVFHTNFGLNFTWWDRWMQTENKSIRQTIKRH